MLRCICAGGGEQQRPRSSPHTFRFALPDASVRLHASSPLSHLSTTCRASPACCRAPRAPRVPARPAAPRRSADAPAGTARRPPAPAQPRMRAARSGVAAVGRQLRLTWPRPPRRLLVTNSCVWRPIAAEQASRRVTRRSSGAACRRRPPCLLGEAAWALVRAGEGARSGMLQLSSMRKPSEVKGDGDFPIVSHTNCIPYRALNCRSLQRVPSNPFHRLTPPIKYPTPPSAHLQTAMEAAAWSVDLGVRALFSGPRGPVRPSQPSALCECALLSPPPRDLRALRRFPVLKRRVLSAWRAQLGAARSTGDAARATRALALALAQSALLQDPEVALEIAAGGFPEVLRAVVLDAGRSRAKSEAQLPLATRVFLATSAVQWLVERQRERREEGELRWVAEVAAKLAEELMEAVADTRAPKKSSLTDEGGATRATSMQLCDFCRRGEDGRAVALSTVRAKYWRDILLRVKSCLTEVRKLKDARTHTETVGALVALRESLTPFGVNSAPAALPSTWETQRVQARSSRRRPLNQNYISLQQYEDVCCYVTSSRESSSVGNSRARCLWRLAWQKERRKLSQDNRVPLCDVILQCARSDIFAQAAACSMLDASLSSSSPTPSVGCQVVCRIFQLLKWRGVADILSVFSEVAAQSDSYNAKPSRKHLVFSKSASVDSLVQDRCIIYLQDVLLVVTDGAVNSSSTKPGETASSILKTLDSTSILDSLRYASQIIKSTPVWMNSWDLLFLHYSTPRSSSLPGASEGTGWFEAIEKCVASVCTATKSPDDTSLVRDLKEYCLAIVHMIILSSGSKISSGGRVQRDLIRDAADRTKIHQMLARMLQILGPQWLSGLIVKISRRLLRSPRGTAADEVWLGTRVILLPAMYMSFQDGMSTRKYAQLRDSQDVFVEIMREANTMLSSVELDNKYISTLVEFCYTWDEFLLTQESDTISPTTARWGSRAVVKMNMFKELIDLYNSEGSALAEEKGNVLMFLSETLQRATNYPQSLENDLFDLITRTTATAELLEERTTNFGDGKGSQVQYYPRPRVSHSNELLKEVFRAASIAEPDRMKDAVKQLEQHGMLSQLIQQLKRWALAIESGREGSVGRETFIELAVHCSRLSFWAPDHTQDLRILMRGLEPAVVGAVKSLVKVKLGRKDGLRDAASGLLRTDTSPVSSLARAEMAVRSYLRVGSLPDLCALTVLLVKTLLKCEASSTREALLDMMQRQSSALVVECVDHTLAKTIKGIEPFDLVFRNDNETKAMPALRRTLAALDLIGSENPVFATPVPSLIMDRTFVELWLPYLFDCMLGSNLHLCSEALTKSLLTSLHSIASRPDSNTFASCYWLAGMLNAVQLLGHPSKKQSNHDEIGLHDDLRSITISVLTNLKKVRANVKNPRPKSSERDVDALVLSRSSLRVGTLGIEDDMPRHAMSVRNLNQDSEREASALIIERLHVDTDQWLGSGDIVMLSFSWWLKGAFVYSQGFISNSIGDTSLSSTGKLWEVAYLDVVNRIYLPLEFESSRFQLASSWLFIWISSNLRRFKSRKVMLQVLPFQVSWFQRLIRYHASRAHLETQVKVFSLVFKILSYVARATTGDSIEEMPRSIDIAEQCLDAVQIIDLSIAVDFASGRGTASGADLLFELGLFSTLLRELNIPAQTTSRLVLYPVELAVTFYVNTLGDAGKEQESNLFLQELSTNLKEVWTMTDPTTDTWAQWGSEMNAKYAWIDRDRFLAVMNTICGGAHPEDK